MNDQNFTIRHTEPSDYLALCGLHAQPRVIRGTLQLPFPSEEQWKQRLEQPPGNLIGLVACTAEDVVGSLGLYAGSRSPRRRHAGEIGMAVHDGWQGRGVGTALIAAAIDLADNWLNLTRLELTVFTDNEPAIALYTKFGFRTEGTLEQYAYRDGRYANAYCMARIKTEKEKC